MLYIIINSCSLNTITQTKSLNRSMCHKTCQSRIPKPASLTLLAFMPLLKSTSIVRWDSTTRRHMLTGGGRRPEHVIGIRASEISETRGQNLAELWLTVARNVLPSVMWILVEPNSALSMLLEQLRSLWRHSIDRKEKYCVYLGASAWLDITFP